MSSQNATTTDNHSPTILRIALKDVPEPKPDFPEHWIVGDMEEILSRTAEQPRWIIDGLLLEHSGTMVSGQPHGGKSLNWLCAAIESVTTRRVWGRFKCADIKRVLYVETEDPQVLVETRVRQLAKGLGVEAMPNGFHLAITGPFDLASMEKELGALIHSVEPDWVVLSTLQGLLGARDWKEQRDMGPVNAIFVRLTLKCPIVVITHSPWNREHKRAAGSVTQAANFLTLVHFEKKIADDGETLTTVNVDGKLGNEVPTFKLSLETEGTEIRRVVYKSASKEEQLRAYFENNPDATPKQAADAVGCTPRHASGIKKKAQVM